MQKLIFVHVVLSEVCLKLLYSQGFSLVHIQHKDKDFLVAFGGSKKELSNQVGDLHCFHID